MQENFVGKRLDGRYEIRELIGVGGMAVVYKAYDNVDDRIVAVKILKEEFLANEEFRRRFKNESKAIAVLSHPNIVKVHDVSFGDVIQYIVMEHISGITLKDYIQQQGVISWKDALHFASQVLKALQHAHEKGIVHRDIKPQNIMLLANGTVKVTDFGIARFSRSEQKTITDKAIGSVHYISPEQARGDFTDGKADIYSVGVLLYEMTTGRVPFQADSAVSVAIMQLQNEPTKPTLLNSLIPTGLEEIILKAMQKNPQNRYSSAQAMLDDLNLVLADQATVFNYEYNVHPDEPTKTVEVPKKYKTAKNEIEDDEPKKTPIVPVLAAIALVFVIVIGVLIGVFWIFMNDNTETIACPNLVGKNYYEILEQEEYNKYTIVTNSEEWEHTEYDYGYIFKQSPEAGRSIKESSEITVYVSLGQKQTELPNYSSESYDAAFDQMTALGLDVKRVDLADDTVEAGFIIKTVPPAGSSVASGDEITVYVSTGAEIVNREVPDVSGMTKDAAKKMLEAKGFTLGNVSKEYDETTPEGLVISQNPSEGTEANIGVGVNIVISKGPEPITTTTAPQEKEVQFNVALPTSTDTVDLTVYVDGILDGSLSATIDLSSRSTYDFTLTGVSTTSTVKVKINGVDYIVYTVNFQTGQTSSTVHDISSALSQNPVY